MDDWIGSEEDIRIYNAIQERQAILDKGWNRSRRPKRFIGSRQVSEEEWESHQRRQAERMQDLSSVDKYTSTGEEWEVDSDGLGYTPNWLQDKEEY